MVLLTRNSSSTPGNCKRKGMESSIGAFHPRHPFRDHHELPVSVVSHLRSSGPDLRRRPFNAVPVRLYRCLEHRCRYDRCHLPDLSSELSAVDFSCTDRDISKYSSYRSVFLLVLCSRPRWIHSRLGWPYLLYRISCCRTGPF